MTKLERTLGLRSVVLFGLAYMTPIIVLGIFGITADLTLGASAGAYALGLIAMLFTAFSYGQLARVFPVAGSAYTYVRKSINDHLGFLVGWAILLDYLFLPMVIWLIGGAYLQAQFPSVPFAIWILFFIALTTALNIIGFKVADKANFALMAFQSLVIIIFVGLCIVYVAGGDGAGTLLSVEPFYANTTTWTALTAGAAVSAYSFLGFDAVTTLTEETKDPKNTIPRAIMLVALIGGAIFIVTAYFTTLAKPGNQFEEVGSAAFEIAKMVGGAFFSSVFIAGLVIGQFASGLAAQASASRLIFAMGRDGVLPKGLFAKLNDAYKTPVPAIIVVGVVGLLALQLDIATSTSFINFGAFTAFTLVNVSVIAYYLKNRSADRSILRWVLIPSIGTVVDAYLLLQLDDNAKRLGLIWLGIGILILLVITKGLRQKPPAMSDPVGM
ncbi:MAG: APC family permease [Actinobacteria bacterium]|nr:APC family permease [Actinomycetota bacterium]